MVPVLLFFIYFFALLSVLTWILKKKHIDLSFWEITLFFSFKVLLGCLYGYIYLKVYHGDDTWNFFADSLKDYDKMITQPGLFFQDLLPYSAFQAAHGFWQGMTYYISNLEYWLTVKMLAFFNIFSRGNYYVDVVIFDFVISFGPVILYKMLLAAFPGRRQILLLLVFFIPSISFWLSGIRAEGLVLLFVALIFYYTDKWFSGKKRVHWFIVMAGLLGFAIFRDQSLVIFLPAYFCWTLSRKAGQKALYYYIWLYTGCLCVFLASLILSPEKNLANPLAARQAAFFRLHGNTRFSLDTLEPTLPGVLRVLPEAFSNTLLRPYVWEAKGPLQWVSSLDVLAFWGLVILAAWFPSRDRRMVLGHPLILCFFFYAVTQIILIGYVVPFPGAIIRYKALPELLLVLGIGVSIKPGFYKL